MVSGEIQGKWLAAQSLSNTWNSGISATSHSQSAVEEDEEKKRGVCHLLIFDSEEVERRQSYQNSYSQSPQFKSLHSTAITSSAHALCKN